MTSVTDTIFHLQPSNGVAVNGVSPLRNFSVRCSSSTGTHPQHMPRNGPTAHSQCFHNSFQQRSAVFHSVPQLLPAPACNAMLSHFQPRASRAVQRQRWPHRCVFPPSCARCYFLRLAHLHGETSHAVPVLLALAATAVKVSAPTSSLSHPLALGPLLLGRAVCRRQPPGGGSASPRVSGGEGGVPGGHRRVGEEAVQRHVGPPPRMSP